MFSLSLCRLKRLKGTLLVVLSAMFICAVGIYADSDGGYIVDFRINETLPMHS